MRELSNVSPELFFDPELFPEFVPRNSVHYSGGSGFIHRLLHHFHLELMADDRSEDKTKYPPQWCTMNEKIVCIVHNLSMIMYTRENEAFVAFSSRLNLVN